MSLVDVSLGWGSNLSPFARSWLFGLVHLEGLSLVKWSPNVTSGVFLVGKVFESWC